MFTRINYRHAYISSRQSPTEVGRDPEPPRATLLTNFLRLLHSHQFLQTYSFILGTFNAAFFQFPADPIGTLDLKCNLFENSVSVFKC